MSQSRSIKPAMRGPVHNLVSYPSPSVPWSSSYGKHRNESALRRELRPARQCFISAAQFFCSTRITKQCNISRINLAHDVFLPASLPTGTTGRPKRRSSNTPKSSFIRRKSHIPTDRYQTLKIVRASMRPQSPLVHRYSVFAKHIRYKKTDAT
jgi:hypothetical protein